MKRLTTVLLVVCLCAAAFPVANAAGLTRLTYTVAKKTALTKARKVTHLSGGEVTTMMSTGRNRWYAQVTMNEFCWVGMKVFLRRGRPASRITEQICEDDPSGDSGSSGGTTQQFPDVHCPECFYGRA